MIQARGSNGRFAVATLSGVIGCPHCQKLIVYDEFKRDDETGFVVRVAKPRCCEHCNGDLV